MKLLRENKDWQSQLSGLETRLVRVKKVVMVEIGGELIKNSSLKGFGKKGKKRDRSVVVYFRLVGVKGAFGLGGRRLPR